MLPMRTWITKTKLMLTQRSEKIHSIHENTVWPNGLRSLLCVNGNFVYSRCIYWVLVVRVFKRLRSAKTKKRSKIHVRNEAETFRLCRSWSLKRQGHVLAYLTCCSTTVYPLILWSAKVLRLTDTVLWVRDHDFLRTPIDIRPMTVGYSDLSRFQAIDMKTVNKMKSIVRTKLNTHPSSNVPTQKHRARLRPSTGHPEIR